MSKNPSAIYQPSFALKYHHFATVYPTLFRKVKNVKFERERITTLDEDFLDLDWSKVGSNKLVITLHGLEGSSDSTYIKGMVKMVNQNNWDAVALNFRGCSGSPNLQRRAYHSGETEDIGFVLDRIFQSNFYQEIILIGFSLGGNVVLKYTGEKGNAINKKIKKVVSISAPIDLKGCSMEIQKWNNFVYNGRFIKALKNKYKLKQHLYPDLDPNVVLNVKKLPDFDEAFTAPVHGFSSAEDYWEKSSSKQFLPNISIPTLILSSKDDSFLSESCYPFEEAKANPNLNLIISKFGGHVGFSQKHPKEYYWSEEQTLNFIAS